ncbi:MAG: hypothetical protein CMO98_05015 [Woeseia sp.]|nr:hypothetical protein [Woeseia sp.]
MRDRSNPFLAPEGIPFIAAVGILVIVSWNLLGLTFTIIPILVLIWLFLIFRDPMRVSPAAPLGVLSPVDGVIVGVGLTNQGSIHPEAHKIIIAVNSLGTYTARCPAEGKIMDIRVSRKDGRTTPSENGLWVQTDEGDDVVLQFNGHRFNVAPRAFLGYGERVGQGQRCAYLRLTRVAEIQISADSRILVNVGQKVLAGVDVLGELPSH